MHFNEELFSNIIVLNWQIPNKLKIALNIHLIGQSPKIYVMIMCQSKLKSPKFYVLSN